MEEEEEEEVPDTCSTALLERETSSVILPDPCGLNSFDSDLRLKHRSATFHAGIIPIVPFTLPVD
ncbi:hypothetical protein EYF80_027394 [Liparis tanakae]|uniref:Uncharacterized protein n=1 Tax=Liparis tanakae TaxID=230148 RepID=A0A4Z2HBK4_9TELE|nr:hypothetical protein EYF80_027394 [Liparis tanakae]